MPASHLIRRLVVRFNTGLYLAIVYCSLSRLSYMGLSLISPYTLNLIPYTFPTLFYIFSSISSAIVVAVSLTEASLTSLFRGSFLSGLKSVQ